MPNFNQVNLAGHLSRDPELSYLPSQTAVCNCAIAINQKYTDSGNIKQEKTCFIDVVIFGKRGETFVKYLKKGSPILLTGSLTFHRWTGKGDVIHSKHSVTVREFVFLNDGKKGANDADFNSK